MGFEDCNSGARSGVSIFFDSPGLQHFDHFLGELVDKNDKKRQKRLVVRSHYSPFSVPFYSPYCFLTFNWVCLGQVSDSCLMSSVVFFSSIEFEVLIQEEGSLRQNLITLRLDLWASFTTETSFLLQWCSHTHCFMIGCWEIPGLQ